LRVLLRLSRLLHGGLLLDILRIRQQLVDIQGHGGSFLTKPFTILPGEAKAASAGRPLIQIKLGLP